MSLTEEGAAYYERCKRILVELDDAETSLSRAQREPRGRLRVDAPTVLGRVIGPALTPLLARYPELAIDLGVRDHVIDPTAEGIDVTLRMATLRDTDLVSRNLDALRMVVAGSPRYLANHGRPRRPDDLANHPLIGFLSGGAARARVEIAPTWKEPVLRRHLGPGSALIPGETMDDRRLLSCSAK
ncbi:MAG TPA: LysR substrate-binding domain-containing protein [Kofleriaceae bacterium]|nr:LysR substrate-binding domain-containing protein [Kofleriaceae bacterium]